MRRLLAFCLLLTAAAAHGQLNVQTRDIKDGAVTTAKIANGAVTADKLADGAAGSVTSVNVATAVPGLSFSGGPITGTGTVTFGISDTALFRQALGLAIGVNVPSVSGTGATGDWSINVTGTAASLNDGGQTFAYDPDAGAWTTGALFVPGEAKADFFIGDGSQITGIDPANIQVGTAAISITGSAATAAGLSASTQTMGWNAANSRWDLTGGLNVTGPVIGDSFTGSASGLTNVPADQFGASKIPVANLGTGAPTASTYLNGAGAWTAKDWLTSASSLDATKLTGTASVNTTGTAGNVTGTVAVANGGTGATTAAAARTNLGLVIGTDVLAPNGSGTGLSGVALLGSANTFTAAQTVTASPASGGAVDATNNSTGVNAWGVRGVAGSATGNVSYGVQGVYGGTNSSNGGVYGSAPNGIGVRGVSAAVVGVQGEATGGKGVYGVATTGVAVQGSVSSTGYAGIFTGGNVGIGTTSPTYTLHVAPTSGDTAGQTVFFKGSTDTGVVIKGGSAQAARYLDVQNSSGTTLAYITKTGGIVSNDATKGVVLRSPSGHYWRITVGDTGTLSTTDLGTTAP